MSVKVTHVLKDGTKLDSIEGHVVRREDCPEAYEALRKIALEQAKAKTDTQSA